MGSKKNGKKVAIIGGGLGGMAAAITCASEGFEVTLFEKNDKLGGKLNHKQVDGFNFDLGPSIIILPQYFRRLFERAGKNMDDYVKLVELTPQWRSFFEDGTVVDLHPDMAKMEQELARLGKDAEGYWAFMEYSRRMFKFAEEAYFEGASDGALDLARSHTPNQIRRGTDVFRTMHSGVAHYVKEPHLQQMLDFFIKYVGSSPYDAPGTMNLLPYAQLGFGLFYVDGGMYNLARAFCRLMEELGVKTELGAEVKAIDRAANRVTGIRLAGGRQVYADVVVSNMEVIPTYKRLLDHHSGLMMRRYQYMYEPAASGLVIHLGVKNSYPQLQHHNFFHSADAERFLHQIHRKKELPDDPTVYLVCPTVTNPELAPTDHTIIKILPHTPYIQDRPFSTHDYAALKERVYDKLERLGLKGLRASTVVEDLLTPEDIQRLYYSHKGSIYGVVSDWKRNLALKAPKKSELFDNLFFVGGSVNPGGGTCMVVLSGQQAGAMIAKQFAN